ncbi:hypothetical protein OROGR_015773 [Orobanche gracilis]
MSQKHTHTRCSTNTHTNNRYSHGCRELEGSSGGSIWYFPIPGEFMSSVLRWTAAKVRFRASDSGDYCRFDFLRVPVGLRDSGGMTHLTGGGSTDSSRSGSGFIHMGSITDATILHHVCIVLLLLWFLNSFNYCHPVAYFLSLIYLYLVHEGYVLKLRKKLQFEEKRESNQRRVLSESETVRWLSYAVEKIWLVCMKEIVSQKILLPIFPWFLKKYKPWTVFWGAKESLQLKDVEIQHLYLGSSPPIITEMRVVQHSSGDDHLVLELGLNFRTADDMSAILGVNQDL